MKSASLRRAIGLAFLYIGVFVLLVLLQFSRGPGFSESFGRLAVEASFPKAERGKTNAVPDSLRISYAGLRLNVSDASPAMLIGEGGSSREIALASIAKQDDGVRIKFKGGAELRASVDREGGEGFILSASLPQGAAELRLRYELRSAKLDVKEGKQVLESGGNSYEIALSGAALGTGKLSLRSASAGRAAFSIRPKEAVASKTSAGSEKLATQAPKDQAAFDAEIAIWRDKAWTGLSSARYDGERAAWKDADGGYRFTDRALAAYCAEAFSRGSYAGALERVKRAKELWPDRLSYVTAPFAGGLVPKMQALEAADLIEAKRLSQLVSDKSLDLFLKENLVHFLFDRAPFDLALAAMRLAAEIDSSRLDLDQAIGLLGCVVESNAYLKDEENPFRVHGGVSEMIVAALRKTTEGFFLATEEDGSSDLRLSLLAGIYLAQQGRVEGKPVLVGIGQSLVEGVLALSDAHGFVPARALAREGSLELRSGTLAPEEIYPLVAGNPYYPREVSFYREVAPGAWAWTCAPELSVDATASLYTFRAAFPEGFSHYIAFYGIKSFANIQLYDIDYSPDAQFEIYDASGYLYNKATGALYIKMKHKKSREDIKLFF